MSVIRASLIATRSARLERPVRFRRSIALRQVGPCAEPLRTRSGTCNCVHNSEATMRIVLIVSALLAFPSASATAQMNEARASTPAGKQGPPVYKPALKALPETPRWRTAILQGSTNTEGHRFHIPSLDLLQPVAVILVAPNGADDLTLKLFKDDFTKPLRESSTDDRGIARFQIRTHGDLRIIVSSKEGVKGYQ